jgi:hypothetical protein
MVSEAVCLLPRFNKAVILSQKVNNLRHGVLGKVKTV